VVKDCSVKAATSEKVKVILSEKEVDFNFDKRSGGVSVEDMMRALGSLAEHKQKVR